MLGYAGALLVALALLATGANAVQDTKFGSEDLKTVLVRHRI